MDSAPNATVAVEKLISRCSVLVTDRAVVYFTLVLHLKSADQHFETMWINTKNPVVNNTANTLELR